MPRTWKEDEIFRKKVRNGSIRWQHILSRKNNRNPDSKVDRYYRAPGDHTTANGYHLYWIRSSQKAEQDKETRSRRLQNALDALSGLQTRLNKYNLKTRKDIDAKVSSILRENHCADFIAFEIHEYREYKKVRKNNLAAHEKAIPVAKRGKNTFRLLLAFEPMQFLRKKR